MKQISAKEFIRIWQNAATIQDVINKTGRGKAAVHSRMQNFKKHGIPLKVLNRRTRNDWKELAEYAKKLKA